MNSSPSEKKDSNLDSNSKTRNRLILLLKLFPPVFIFLAGIFILTSKYIWADHPVFQKDIVAGLFIIYSIIRIFQAINSFREANEK